VSSYLLTRTLSVIPTLIGATILVFAMARLVPGSVVEQMVGAEASVSPEALARLRQYFGLDDPVHLQYAKWLTGVLQGDLGSSWRTGLPVLGLVIERLHVTLLLTGGALVVALTVGIPLGILSAVRENSWLDHVIRVVSLFSLSIPIFWQAAMLILVSSLWLGWTPPLRYVGPATDLRATAVIMFLPSIVLGTVVSANIMRMTRSVLLDVLRQDFIRTARAKGLRQRAVLWTHALKNAMIPVVTVIGLQVGYLLGGSVITEEVFNLPGLGRLLLAAVNQRDFPLVQGCILLIASMFVVTNLVVDLVYARLDPRIEYA
jgi:peptide/nickel transport system permease protein